MTRPTEPPDPRDNRTDAAVVIDPPSAIRSVDRLPDRFRSGLLLVCLLIVFGFIRFVRTVATVDAVLLTLALLVVAFVIGKAAATVYVRVVLPRRLRAESQPDEADDLKTAYARCFSAALAKGLARTGAADPDITEWRAQRVTRGLPPIRTLVLGHDQLPPPAVLNAPPEFTEPDEFATHIGPSVVGFAAIAGAGLVCLLLGALTRFYVFTALGATAIAGAVVAGGADLLKVGFGSLTSLRPRVYIAPGRVGTLRAGRTWEATHRSALLIIRKRPQRIEARLLDKSGRVVAWTFRNPRDPDFARLWRAWNYPGDPAPPIFEDAGQ